MTVVQEYEMAADWLEAHGWKRVRFRTDGQSSKFLDPIYPGREFWIQDAIETQKARFLEVPDVMGS
jgi:3-hydroxymyristoyl/3-hydroxydecanoyl-(acyl carrier protein) dehydratase